MTLFYEIVFWLSASALVFSYMIYPAFMLLKMSKTKPDNEAYEYNPDRLPRVSILIPAHNEQGSIEQKLGSIIDSRYPQDLLEIFIGSDASTDSTNEITRAIERKVHNLRLIELPERSGKGAVLNHLAELATGEILIITDADVLLETNTIFELVKVFCNPSVGLVESRVTTKDFSAGPMAAPESRYIELESRIKMAEGLVYGTMIGPFGACFALRKDLFAAIPRTCLVDDFYLNMKVLERGFKTIMNQEAVVFDSSQTDLQEEFRRKVRISTGDFQNLELFFPLLFRFDAISFCFFSHKVLRWFGPWFLLFAYVSSLLLSYPVDRISPFNFYRICFWAQTALLSLPLLDYISSKLTIRIMTIRLLNHFLLANLGLAIGLIRYLMGVKSGVWQPTKR